MQPQVCCIDGLNPHRILDRAVYRQPDITPGPRSGESQRVDDLAACVAQYAMQTVRTRKDCVLSALDAFLTLTIDIREAGHVCRYRAFRVKAAIVAFGMKPRNIEADGGLRDCKWDLPLQIGE